MSNITPQFLKRTGKVDLAYCHCKRASDLPTIMFLGGFRSDMMGSKASFLHEKCEARGQSYIRFDYSGHGQSGGDFEEGCITDWAQDAQDILVHCLEVDERVILVGSSMGGWISLLLTHRGEKRVQALIGIAAAPDFTIWMEEAMNDDQRQALQDKGFFELPSDYGTPYIITKRLIDDGRQNFLLDGEIKVNVPVRLLQGKQDKDVPWETAERIKSALRSDDVDIIYREEGNHSLSAPDDLSVLDRVIESLSR